MSVTAGPAAPASAARDGPAVTFWLGTHRPEWLAATDVPLMVSHRRLRSRLGPRARLPRAREPWVLDSGGYTELAQQGRWTFTAAEYAEALGRYGEEIGQLAWAAPMD